MRILVLSKRQYTNRDLIDDRFGRLRELPLALASAGNEVAGICLSYRPRDEGRRDDVENDVRVVWHTLNLKRLFPQSATNYWKTIDSLGRDFRPDVVWACSDAWHAILGEHVSKRLGAPMIIDLYDNFESFPATRLPGVTTVFRRSLRYAAGITCVSSPLARYTRETSLCECPIEVIENGVPDGLFHPLDKAECRRELRLPADALLIGTAGAISKSRGIETLFRAFEILERERSDVHLVLAGTCDRGLTIPKGARIHYLGILPSRKIPFFLSTLDISVICNRKSSFGKYCFPQKFYESVAAGVPVVAAETGAMQELLEDKPEHLYEPENVQDLVAVLCKQIENPSVPALRVPTWAALGKRLDDFFCSCKKETAGQE